MSRPVGRRRFNVASYVAVFTVALVIVVSVVSGASFGSHRPSFEPPKNRSCPQFGDGDATVTTTVTFDGGSVRATSAGKVVVKGVVPTDPPPTLPPDSEIAKCLLGVDGDIRQISWNDGTATFDIDITGKRHHHLNVPNRDDQAWNEVGLDLSPFEIRLGSHFCSNSEDPPPVACKTGSVLRESVKVVQSLVDTNRVPDQKAIAFPAPGLSHQIQDDDTRTSTFEWRWDAGETRTPTFVTVNLPFLTFLRSATDDSLRIPSAYAGPMTIGFGSLSWTFGLIPALPLLIVGTVVLSRFSRFRGLPVRALGLLFALILTQNVYLYGLGRILAPSGDRSSFMRYTDDWVGNLLVSSAALLLITASFGCQRARGATINVGLTVLGASLWLASRVVRDPDLGPVLSLIAASLASLGLLGLVWIAVASAARPVGMLMQLVDVGQSVRRRIRVAGGLALAAALANISGFQVGYSSASAQSDLRIAALRVAADGGVPPERGEYLVALAASVAKGLVDSAGSVTYAILSLLPVLGCGLIAMLLARSGRRQWLPYSDLSDLKDAGYTERGGSIETPVKSERLPRVVDRGAAHRPTSGRPTNSLASAGGEASTFALAVPLALLLVLAAPWSGNGTVTLIVPVPVWLIALIVTSSTLNWLFNHQALLRHSPVAPASISRKALLALAKRTPYAPVTSGAPENVSTSPWRQFGSSSARSPRARRLIRRASWGPGSKPPTRSHLRATLSAYPTAPDDPGGSLFALGPGADDRRLSWFDCGREAARWGALVAVAPIALSVWATLEQFRESTANSGLAYLAISVIGETARWIVLAFLLGAIYRVLPGRIGPLKALSLSTLWTVAALSAAFVGRALGQDLSQQLIYRSAQTFLFLIVVGVLFDLATLRSAGGYSNDLRALYHLYGYGELGAGLAPVVLVVITLVQQIATGSPLDVASSFITGLTSVLKPPGS